MREEDAQRRRLDGIEPRVGAHQLERLLVERPVKAELANRLGDRVVGAPDEPAVAGYYLLPATRAEIIETLLRREYVTRQGKTLAATDKGVRLIAAVHPHVKSPAMTGEWEARLKRIERGQGDLAAFMTGIEAFVREVVGETLAGLGGALEIEDNLGRGTVVTARVAPAPETALAPAPAAASTAATISRNCFRTSSNTCGTSGSFKPVDRRKNWSICPATKSS